jgi:uncharacterized protein YlzI (FlbEa/FlbD family)
MEVNVENCDEMTLVDAREGKPPAFAAIEFETQIWVEIPRAERVWLGDKIRLEKHPVIVNPSYVEKVSPYYEYTGDGTRIVEHLTNIQMRSGKVVTVCGTVREVVDKLRGTA